MQERDNSVSVYGLGYVGLTLCAAWLRAGHKVLGVDILKEKVQALNNGVISHIELDVAQEIAKAVSNGCFRATLEGIRASEQSKAKIIAVPVGLDDHGRPALTDLEGTVRTLAQGLKSEDLVVLESSVPPGTTQNLVRSLLEEISGLEAEKDFFLAYSPERIYVGRALEDLVTRYPKIIGGVGPQSSKSAGTLYRKIAERGVRIVTSPTVAEFEKLAEGVYRDVNIALANELAVLASTAGIDYDEVSETANSQPFCHLHNPGVGVGGACIPVYPLFLASLAKTLGLDLKLVTTARQINTFMPNHIGRLVLQLASKINPRNSRIAILGLAFRGGIDDARFSPTYDLIDALIKNGVDEITVNDPYIPNDPLLAKLGYKLTSELNEALRDKDIVVFAADHPQYKSLTLRDLKERMQRERIGVVDGRHVISEWKNPPRGVVYVGVGRPFRDSTQKEM